MPPDAALDDPVGRSLRGAHAHLARRHGTALGYQPEVATFCAVPPDPAAADWADLAALLGPGGFADLFSSPATPPAGWAPVFELGGLQLVATPGAGRPATTDGLLRLGPDDVPDMLALAAATRPGPFWTRTLTMGAYLGVRDRGRLVAMAGERLRPPGWTEVSAVCTAPEARGRGLAARLVAALVAEAAGRGEGSFLHVAADNHGARRVYERLGFVVRRPVTFRGFRTPG